MIRAASAAASIDSQSRQTARSIVPPGDSTENFILAKRSDTLHLFPALAQAAKAVATRPAALNKEHRITADPDPEAGVLWQKCLDIIADNVDLQVFRTWFEPISALCWSGDVLTLQVPSQFFLEWIEEHYYKLLQKTIYQTLGPKARLQYNVVVKKSTDTLEQRAIKLPAFRSTPAAQQPALPFAAVPAVDSFPSFLNQRYNFGNFIRGESNQLALSAGLAIAENPGGTRFNPLFIYGSTGLGKTHLVQAIGNQIAQNNRSARVLYTNSERFTIEYVNAIQSNKVNDFTNFYRSIDALIIDDIQFFAGKEKTQDNFFHTFNVLYQSGKQLILTSDKPPKELADVDERLVSRFQWGLTVDVQPPDFEMRMAILQRKSTDEGFDLPLDVTEYIARHIFTSVRELEGCLISIIAKVSLDRRKLTLDLAKEVVQGSATAAAKQRRFGLDDIKREVAGYYGLAVPLLEGASRKHEIALARQIAMYLAKQLTPLSLKAIGAGFGKRDHTTVIHSCRTIENYLESDATLRDTLGELKKKF